MVYVKDVGRGLAFYRDLLGFKLIEDFRYENKPVYAPARTGGRRVLVCVMPQAPAPSEGSARSRS
jgi:catechol 2,3-dioxygenase-like lactoylglutathione lyase family enzyme